MSGDAYPFTRKPDKLSTPQRGALGGIVSHRRIRRSGDHYLFSLKPDKLVHAAGQLRRPGENGAQCDRAHHRSEAHLPTRVAAMLLLCWYPLHVQMCPTGGSHQLLGQADCTASNILLEVLNKTWGDKVLSLTPRVVKSKATESSIAAAGGDLHGGAACRQGPCTHPEQSIALPEGIEHRFFPSASLMRASDAACGG